MNFGFLLFSLLMVFLLVLIYYAKDNQFIQKRVVYRSILLVTYVIQLVSCAIFITSGDEVYSMVFGKIYFVMLFLWFGLFLLYDVSLFLRDKFQGKLKQIIIGFFAIFFVLVGTCFMVVPVSLVDRMVDYSNHISYYFILVILVLELFLLLLGIKKIDRRNYFHLVMIFLIQTITFFLQGRSPELPFLHIGMILVVFYSYFTLENVDREELEMVTLERDYALKNVFDKNSFLRTLSHEIRTPINTIDGFSQVIMDSDDLTEIKEDTKDIRLASRDLVDIINGMIDLSLIESGNLEIINENYNVYDMLDGIIQIVNAKIRDKNLEFVNILEENIPEVLEGDSERISQVVLNLLTNAIKYTEKGEISLRVESVKSSSRCRLKFVVEDTGKGMTQEEVNHLFEQESRGENSGLGVIVSKYLIELMGGKLEVESVLGKGTKFTVSLDQKIIRLKQEKGSRRSKEFHPFKDPSKRVLIVDDNKLNLKVASKLLAPYEVEVVEANSGQECLDILDKDIHFDLILMDDLMPCLSGTETLDILKKIQRVDGYYIPVVVLTANAVSGMKEKYLNVGFEDYLAKPIDKYELDRILKKYLKGKK